MGRMNYDDMDKPDYMAHDGIDWRAYYWLGHSWRRPLRAMRWIFSKESRTLREAIIRNGGSDPWRR